MWVFLYVAEGVPQERVQYFRVSRAHVPECVGCQRPDGGDG